MELTNTFTPDVAGQEHVAKEKQGNFEGLSVVLRNPGDRRAINFGGLSSSEVNKLLVAAASPELKSPLSKPPVALLQTISSPSTVLQSCWPSPAAGSLQAGSIKIMINIPRTSIDLNRANSFHELRQVKIISDPRTLEPVDDKQRSQLLADVIKTFAFNATSQKQPQVHVITGQMGAGKSTATNTISDELGGNCVIVDYDELKRFVPGYTEEAQKGYPGTVPGCKKMARYLVEGLKSHGFDNRLNMVIQRSINSKDDEMFKLLQESKLNSYNVSLTILAVDKSASTMGILSRYEAGLKNINEEKNLPMALEERQWNITKMPTKV